jgi:glycine cleavage system regulatory protein
MSGMKEVMLTLIGPDKKGIVARMAAVVESQGGNWLDSRMIRMGGYFSGILRIALPEDQMPHVVTLLIWNSPDTTNRGSSTPFLMLFKRVESMWRN